MSRDLTQLPALPTGSERVCPVCRTGFHAAGRKSRQVYCSPTCRAEAARQHEPVMRTCPQCNGEFAAAVSPRRIFCSHECRIQSRNRAEALEERTCLVCENTFEAPTTTRQVYCAPECRREADRRRGHARDQDRARRLGEAPRPQAAPKALAPPPVRPAPRQHPTVRDPLEPAATRNCPHCDKPITIVALLATPEAARPVIPGRLPDITPLRRTP